MPQHSSWQCLAECGWTIRQSSKRPKAFQLNITYPAWAVKRFPAACYGQFYQRQVLTRSYECPSDGAVRLVWRAGTAAVLRIASKYH